jgi:anti-sigma regulatory factor (Ser/Thr protein kinase)/ketosteroid isomerase-like protein
MTAEALVREAFRAFNARDADAFAALMHPEIVFMPLLTGATAGPYRGRAGMRRYVEDAFRWAQAGEVRIGHGQDFGDVVVLHGEIAVRTERGQLEMDAVYVARVRAGLISELVTLSDAATARRVLGIEPALAAGDLRLELPAQPASVRTGRHAARGFAQAAGCADLAGIELAVTEALTNVVLHAYIDDPEPGGMRLEGRRESGAVVFSVGDQGRGLLPRLDSPGLGMGLAVMQHHAAEITFVGAPQRPRGTEVRLRFDCAAGESDEPAAGAPRS